MGRCDEPVADFVCPKADKVVFEEEYQYIDDKDGNRTELAVQRNVYWLKAKVVDGKADIKLLCGMEGV